ncbi:MAG: PIN domain-containing protein [Longimicrobiales bacterium]
MSFLCDTTVLFAACDASHQHHLPSLALVTRAKPASSFVAAHSLAELYATLSGQSAPKMRRLERVLEAVDHVSRVFTPVALEPSDYLWVLRQVTAAEARSGQVYDALILRCAERANVETVYTWNTRHFERVAWAGMAERVRTP